MDKKTLLKKYHENEEDNNHDANALMLAKNFGTSAEVRQVEQAIQAWKRKGYMNLNSKEAKFLYSMHKKYYKKLKESKELNIMSEEARKAGKDKNLPTHDTHASDQVPEKDEVPAPDADPRDLEDKHLSSGSLDKAIDVLENIIKDKSNKAIKALKESLYQKAGQKIERMSKKHKLSL